MHKKMRKEAWTVTTLVAWTLRKHRNVIVLNGASPSADTMLAQIDTEG